MGSVAIHEKKGVVRMKTVVYAGTRNLYRTMKTAVRSLLENNRIDRVYLLIEDDCFPYPMQENVKTLNVSNQQFFPENGANYRSKWSYMALMKCALSKMLEEKTVLWLDCDTIVDADISELFDIDLTGYYFAGVKEIAKSKDGYDYINAGVLLMNLEEIRQNRHDDRLITALNYAPMELPDQDAINELSQGKMLFLDARYNVSPFSERCSTPSIVHFAGRYVFDNDSYYRKYATEERALRTLIAVPCIDSAPTGFTEAFLGMEKGNAQFTFVKNTLIYTARNMIARNAILYGFDRVLWLDSDIQVKTDTLTRLAADMDTGLDYVTGIYFMRMLPTKPVVYSDVWWRLNKDNVETGSKNIDTIPDSLFEIAGSGFGCVMTSVDLLKEMVATHGAPFSPLMGMSEDLSFCWRVKQAGIKMYCDPAVKVGHIGQYVYTEGDWRNE